MLWCTVHKVEQVMHDAQQYVRKLYGALSDSNVIDITVSCDGT